MAEKGRKAKFLFDLDGTITKEETLPLIAKHFRVEEDIARLTRETVAGMVPFEESFARRVRILGRFPVDEVAGLLEEVELHPMMADFIRRNRDACRIVTGNLSCWIGKLVQKLGCGCYASKAEVRDNRVASLSSVLHKEEVVRRLVGEGCKVVFVGDGNNDIEAMRLADVSIAAGLTHKPAEGVLSVANHVAVDEKELYERLNRLLLDG